MSDTTDLLAGETAGIDPRGPCFGAAITSVLLLIAVFLGLTGLSAERNLGGTADGWAVSSASMLERLSDPALVLLVVLAALFAWGAFAGIERHPYGLIFRLVVRRRLAAAETLENPVPPSFAQGVGLLVTVVGVVLHLAGVPLAIPIAAGAAFVAAFLNAAFGYCLGCQIYLLLARAGAVGRGSASPA